MASDEPRKPKSINLDDAYSVKTPDDNRRLYARWAATYESEFVDKELYRYPQAIAEVFHQHIANEGISHVVDVGTGTGLTGAFLARHRPQLVIDGVDISQEMLEQAIIKSRRDGSPVYSQLFERDLTQEVSFTNAPYDALVCSGTFTHGHLGPDAIENLIHLVRRDGWFVIGVNNEHFLARGFEREIADYVDRGLITMPRVERIDVYEDGSPHRGDQARVLIFSRC